jgi:hypothetical protein
MVMNDGNRYGRCSYVIAIPAVALATKIFVGIFGSFPTYEHVIP